MADVLEQQGGNSIARWLRRELANVRVADGDGGNKRPCRAQRIFACAERRCIDGRAAA